MFLEDIESFDSEASGSFVIEYGVRFPRGVAGTTVWVDVVDRDDDEDVLDGAGDRLRGEAGVLGIDALRGVRRLSVLSYASCSDFCRYWIKINGMRKGRDIILERTWRDLGESSLSYSRNSFA